MSPLGLFRTARGQVDAATLILRLFASFPFIYAGIGKLGRDQAMVSGMFQSMGLASATAQTLTVVIGTLEVLSGIGLILGLFTRLAALFQLMPPLFGLVVVYKYDITQDSAILLTTLIGAALFLLIFGAGRYSLDARIARS